MTTFKCIDSLEENPSEIFLEVSSILLKLVDNVLLYPSNPKYRKLRLENKLVSGIIIPSIGAMECLFELGFQENDDSLLLPPEKTSIEKLTKFRTEISDRRNKYLNNGQTAKSNKENTSSSAPVVPERQSTPQPGGASAAKPPEPSRIAPQPSTASSNFSSNHSYLENLHRRSSQVLQYESEDLKRKVLRLVPLTEIGERVQKRMRQIQKQALKADEPVNEASLQETLFITELMAWFKNDFFRWVNSPKCDLCDADTQFVEMSSDPKELTLADRVEVYKCKKCGGRILFPRFNDVNKLLDERRGRCGEWANTFTAICRALNLEARHVVDETDHVWTEVWFLSEQRWVHCDPCECALDKPLLYEKGWKKQLSYIIAFAHDHVQDVTWRYSANHKAVLARRKHVSEPQLVRFITELNSNRQAQLSLKRRKELARRVLTELVQMMLPAVDSEGDTQGRQSGSLAWRLARSETTLTQETTQAGYVFTPTPQEIEAKKIVVSYCPVTDEYVRGLTGEKTKDWRTRAFCVENIFRKEEKDWKTVYLCRTEGSSAEGKVSWKVDVSKSGLSVNQVEVKCLSSTFESGRVRWLLCSGDKCVPILNGALKTSELRGCTEVTLSATLSGGNGDVAWQHAQLFRQSLDSSDPALLVTLTLSPP